MSAIPELRDNVIRAVCTAAPGWSFARDKIRSRIIDAVMAAIEPIVTEGLTHAHTQGDAEGWARGFEQGRLQGISDALFEAETMLRRHGHRSAVDRVHALAATRIPARPQPVNASPAGGPGPSEPQDGIYDYGTRTWHPVPTPPENGAQRGVQGLQGAIDAASDAERERRERDAWVGHAPQQADHG